MKFHGSRSQVLYQSNPGTFSLYTASTISYITWTSATVHLQFNVEQIAFLKIKSQLGVVENKASAIVTLVIVTDTECDLEGNELWFYPEHNTSIMKLNDFLFMIRTWMRHLGRDLQLLESDTYVIIDNLLPLVEASRWPEVIPHPNDTFTRIGEAGLGFISSVLGARVERKVEDVGFNVLERFAKVTLFAKDQTTKALEHPLARPFLPLIPENIRLVFLTSKEAETLLSDYDSAHRYLATFSNDIQEQLGMKKENQKSMIQDETHDFESLRGGYRSHFTGDIVTPEKWEDWHSDDKLAKSSYFVACNIFCGGIEASIRSAIWLRLLKVVEWEQSDSEGEVELTSKRELYQGLKDRWLQVLLEDSQEDNIVKKGEVGDENEDGPEESKFKERKYRIDKDVVRTDQHIPYYTLNQPIDSTKSLAVLVNEHSNLEKLRGVLMTYATTNNDLGYVQGMNDLAAPILETVEDEFLGFFCFRGLMSRMDENFMRDQKGMRSQLRKLELLLKVVDPPLYDHFIRIDGVNMFCCFRWLLVLFKREFGFEEIKTLWEVTWSCPLTNQFHLFIGVAILNHHRQELFGAQAFDEVLKVINDLSMKIIVPEMIQHGEVLFYVFRDRLITNGPRELGQAVLTAISMTQVEQTLAKISGIANSDIVLSQRNYPKGDVKDDEWLELVDLFIVDDDYSRGLE